MSSRLGNQIYGYSAFDGTAKYFGVPTERRLMMSAAVQGARRSRLAHNVPSSAVTHGTTTPSGKAKGSGVQSRIGPKPTRGRAHSDLQRDFLTLFCSYPASMRHRSRCQGKKVRRVLYPELCLVPALDTRCTSSVTPAVRQDVSVQ